MTVPPDHYPRCSSPVNEAIQGGPASSSELVPSAMHLNVMVSSTPLVAVLFWKLQPSVLHFVPGIGDSALFDEAAVPFPMTFQDASVVCDQHADDDGDACGSSLEPALGLDPYNSWDFFSAPVPSLLAAPNPRLVFKDKIVSASDAQAVFAYFKAGARVGTAVYEQDLNGNGAADGVEYDRSVTGPAHSGAPDGVVSAQDAQLAFAQYRLNYRC